MKTLACLLLICCVGVFAQEHGKLPIQRPPEVMGMNWTNPDGTTEFIPYAQQDAQLHWSITPGLTTDQLKVALMHALNSYSALLDAYLDSVPRELAEKCLAGWRSETEQHAAELKRFRELLDHIQNHLDSEKGRSK